MKGGGDGRLKMLTKELIGNLFYLHNVRNDDADEVLIEGYNEDIEQSKIEIMDYFADEKIKDAKKKGKHYIKIVTEYFDDKISDEHEEASEIFPTDEEMNKFMGILNIAGKSKKKKKKTKKKKKNKKKKIKGKLAGNPKCVGLDEDDCKSNSRCKWNEFHIKEFDMNTDKGREKLFKLKESLMKRYTKEELIKYLGSEDPTFFRVYMRAKKEYDSGLRGLCGNKMYQKEKMADILIDRVKKDFPDHRSKKSEKSKTDVTDKTDKTDKTDLTEKQIKNLLEAAVKKNKPDEAIEEIIKEYGLMGEKLQDVSDKYGLALSMDRFKDPSPGTSDLMAETDREVEADKLKKKEDDELIARIDRLKSGAGKSKKSKKDKKTKKAKKAKKGKKASK